MHPNSCPVRFEGYAHKLTYCLHADLLLGGDRKPDSDKTREELIKELTQLRDVWRLDQGEIKKLHKVGQGTGEGASANSDARFQHLRPVAVRDLS